MPVILNPYQSFGGAAVIWTDAFVTNFNTTDEGTWTNYTLRLRLTGASLLATGTRCRVGFKAPAAAALGIHHAYIGLQAGAGDVYDFAAAPTELLFSGVSGFAGLGAGSTIWSDDTLFTIDGIANPIISFRVATDSMPRGTIAGNPIAASSHYKNASDAATVNASAYTTDNDVISISGLQVRS